MEKIEDTLLYRAISYYGKYTNNQAKVLCFLVENAVDNRIYPSIKKISEATGVINSTVYAALNALQLDGVIEKSVNQKGILEIKLRLLYKFLIMSLLLLSQGKMI